MFDMEAEMAQVVLTRLDEQRRDAITWLLAAGYKVTKPRAPKVKAEAPKLNAVGKPYSPSYDPNYRMKYKTPKLSRLPQNIGPIEGWTYTNPDAAWNKR